MREAKKDWGEIIPIVERSNLMNNFSPLLISLTTIKFNEYSKNYDVFEALNGYIFKKDLLQDLLNYLRLHQPITH
jgi:hypothetical protein